MGAGKNGKNVEQRFEEKIEKKRKLKRKINGWSSKAFAVGKKFSINLHKRPNDYVICMRHINYHAMQIVLKYATSTHTQKGLKWVGGPARRVRLIRSEWNGQLSINYQLGRGNSSVPKPQKALTLELQLNWLIWTREIIKLAKLII